MRSRFILVGDQYLGMSMNNHAVTKRNSQKDCTCFNFKGRTERSLARFTSGKIANHGSRIPKNHFPESRKARKKESKKGTFLITYSYARKNVSRHQNRERQS